MGSEETEDGSSHDREEGEVGSGRFGVYHQHHTRRQLKSLTLRILPRGVCKTDTRGFEVRVEEGEGSSQLYFDIDVLQGILVGHWNYGLEKMRRELTACFGQGFLALLLRVGCY